MLIADCSGCLQKILQSGVGRLVAGIRTSVLPTNQKVFEIERGPL